MKKADTRRKYVTTKKYNKLVEQIERLQEQLEEANMVILLLPAEKISTCMIACEYLDKWGVK